MSRPTDHEETIEHLRDIARAIRDGSRSRADLPSHLLAEPYPAIEYIPPRLLNAYDRTQLHKLALKLIDRTDDMIIDHGRAPEGLTAAAAALTAATTALLACSTDDAKGGA